jgi:hypothetical protein
VLTTSQPNSPTVNPFPLSAAEKPSQQVATVSESHYSSLRSQTPPKSKHPKRTFLASSYFVPSPHASTTTGDAPQSGSPNVYHRIKPWAIARLTNPPKTYQQPISLAHRPQVRPVPCCRATVRRSRAFLSEPFVSSRREFRRAFWRPRADLRVPFVVRVLVNNGAFELLNLCSLLRNGEEGESVILCSPDSQHHKVIVAT